MSLFSLPRLIWGSKTGKRREKSDFPLSNDKNLLQKCSDQQLPAAKLFVYMFWRQLSNIFRNRCIFISSAVFRFGIQRLAPIVPQRRCAKIIVNDWTTATQCCPVCATSDYLQFRRLQSVINSAARSISPVFGPHNVSLDGTALVECSRSSRLQGCDVGLPLSPWSCSAVPVIIAISCCRHKLWTSA